jgi:hypothetical protein
MVYPYLICPVTIAKQYVHCSLIILLTAWTPTVIQETTNKLHPPRATEVTHVLSRPKLKHLWKVIHCLFHHIPVNQIETCSGHTEMVWTCKEELHGVVVDPSLSHDLFGGI